VYWLRRELLRRGQEALAVRLNVVFFTDCLRTLRTKDVNHNQQGQPEPRGEIGNFYHRFEVHVLIPSDIKMLKTVPWFRSWVTVFWPHSLKLSFRVIFCCVSVGKVTPGRVRVPVLWFAFANYHYHHVPCALLSSMVRTMHPIGVAVTQRQFHPSTRE
jgi:hypothetical protein